VLYPLLGVRLHGWLDDLAVAIYLVGLYVLGAHGPAVVIGLGAATVHLALARFTRYPQGTWGLISFRTHAWVELTEGALVVAGTLLLVPASEFALRVFLLTMGIAQFGAFALSDYRWPVPQKTA